MQIPNDIRQYVINQRTKKLVKFGLTEAVIITYLCLFGERSFAAFGTFSYTLIWILLIATPFFYFRVYDLFLDRPWHGEIVKITVNSSLANTQYYKATQPHNYIKNTVYFDIKDETGKVCRKRAYAINAKFQNDVTDYHVGDTVVHIAGLPHIYVIPTPTTEKVICVVCGGHNLVSHEKCEFCAHSLHLIKKK